VQAIVEEFVYCKGLTEDEAFHRERLLSDEDFRRLGDGYRFLRVLETRLRLKSEQAVEIVDLADPDLEALARKLGFEGTRDEACEALRRELVRIRGDVRPGFASVFATAG
jgi:glutamine synthetase adenylyltransferase